MVTNQADTGWFLLTDIGNKQFKALDRDCDEYMNWKVAQCLYMQAQPDSLTIILHGAVPVQASDVVSKVPAWFFEVEKLYRPPTKPSKKPSKHRPATR